MNIIPKWFRRKSSQPAPAFKFVPLGDASSLTDVIRRVNLASIQAQVISAAMRAKVGFDTDTTEEMCQEAADAIGDIQRRCIGNRSAIGAEDARLILEATFRWCSEHLGIIEPATIS
jgi:hypothetical protein